jgi:hypothetical protein
LEFMTSNELAFPFTWEVAAMARATVKTAKERPATSAQHLIAPGLNWCDLTHNYGMTWAIICFSLDCDANADYYCDQLDALNALDFDMEGWDVFSSMGTVDISSLGGASYPWVATYRIAKLQQQYLLIAGRISASIR